MNNKWNAVIMLHKSGLPLANKMSAVWRKNAAHIVALDNADCPKTYPWADAVVTWPKDPGHNGLEQCRRHLAAVTEAAKLPGVTAILEPDAFVAHQFPVKPGVLYGSRLWDAWEWRDVKNYACRWYVHPPYVADQDTWKKVEEVLKWWLKSNTVWDEGHNDRVLSFAASASQIKLAGVGFSRNTVLTPEDNAELQGALIQKLPLIHGVKDARLIAGWMVKQGVSEPLNIWEELEILPDTRKIPWAMDLMHVELLRALVEQSAPRRAMEIGSYQGHSTAAFLKAMDRLPDMELHLVEPNPTPELLALLDRSPHRSRIVLHKESSWEVGLPVDFVFIDGSHEWPALADLAQALAQQVPCIAMHDTRSHSHGIGGCWGSQLVADILRQATGRTWLCDEQKREGQWTHRGFGFSAIKPNENFTKAFEKL